MAIEQQMEMFNANPRGGLDDDGLKRDPVSGNEIPPGSMANEVRDDVEARLSDGEYVVPANVVRFFGVKFFEDLRTQAMQGLGAMEANGRIGGEPVPSAMPMQDQMANVKPDMSDGEMEMLQGLMNEGGFIRGYAHGGSHETPEYASTAYNPLQYPLTQYATPGASVYNPNLNPNVQALEQTQTAAPTPAGSESTFVTFVNPTTGTIQVLQYINGEPANIDAYNSLIEQGFFVEGGPELAAYKQKQEQDNRESDRQMGGSKPKTLQDLIDSGIYGGTSLGPGASIAGSVLGKMFPTASDQDIIDYIIENKGLMPNTGRGVPLRDANGNVVLNAGGTPKFKTHTSGPLKGLIVRAPGKDGEVKLSEAELAYLETVEDFKKANMKDGSLNYKGLRIDGLKSNIYKEGDGITGKYNLRSLSPTEIIEWYKTQKKKTKSGPVAGGVDSSLSTLDDLTATSRIDPNKYTKSTQDLAFTLAGQDFAKQNKAIADAQRIRNAAEDNNQTVADYYQENRNKAEEDRQETNRQNEDAARGRGTTPVSEGGTGTAGKGVIDKTKDSASAYSGRTGSNREFGMNKGGLIKKPKKKKTKKY